MKSSTILTVAGHLDGEGDHPGEPLEGSVPTLPKICENCQRRHGKPLRDGNIELRPDVRFVPIADIGILQTTRPRNKRGPAAALPLRHNPLKPI
jgi:hypothetical protein